MHNLDHSLGFRSEQRKDAIVFHQKILVRTADTDIIHKRETLFPSQKHLLLVIRHATDIRHMHSAGRESPACGIEQIGRMKLVRHMDIMGYVSEYCLWAQTPHMRLE